MHIKKGYDSAVRAVEQRSADLLGMPVAGVEPLQFVSYTDGQQFDMHHDIGPIDDHQRVVRTTRRTHAH